MRQLKQWIWQHPEWPTFTWNADELINLLSQARLQQGKLLASITNIGLELTNEARGDILTEEAIKTCAIEGEKLDRESVRSSVARHLGLSTFGLPVLPSRAIDGLIEVLLDATHQYMKPLTKERVLSWQAALFPTGYSGLYRIETGNWRTSDEPMQVVSGAMGRETVHFEAVPGTAVDQEMSKFLSWWKSSRDHLDGILRAGIAHFYFVTIHPFEDGNGRLSRALTDMALAQDEKLTSRFYSLSSQILKERKQYYDVLESCQRSAGDITPWLAWFLECYTRAVENSEILLKKVLEKAAFWHHFAQISLNDRQKKAINLLLDTGKGKFLGGLTSRKYVSACKTSRATAFREISDLLDKKVLVKNPTKGRNVSYDLNWEVINPAS